MAYQFATRATTILLLYTAAIIPAVVAQEDFQLELFFDITTEAPFIPTTTVATVAADIIVNPGGTCGSGKGDRGNGICANGKCCSKHGWCGTTPAHCDGKTFQPTLKPSASPIIPPTTIAPTTSPTTATPSTSPTELNWSQLTPGHTSFCGPKLVGGYASAISTCSPKMECGKKEGTATAYGSTGNDCPKGLMCYANIDCVVPSDIPRKMPSESPSMSRKPTIAPSKVPSVNPTLSIMPTPKGQTKDPTIQPTISIKPTGTPTKPKAPTVPPYNLQNSITTRGSYCGATFQAALDTCSPSTSCSGDDDCDGGDEECFPNISCTFHASKADENYLGSVPAEGLDGDTEEEDGDDKEEEEERDGTVSSPEIGFSGNKLGDEYVNSSEVKIFGTAGMMAVSVFFLGTILV